MAHRISLSLRPCTKIRRAGFKPEHDVMPACMQQDAIGPQKLVFDVPAELVAKAYDRHEPSEELWSKVGAG